MRAQQILESFEQKFLAQKENSFLWLPIFFALGISTYFSISFEPPLILSTFILLFWLAIYILLRPLRHKGVMGQGATYISFILLLIIAGFFTATLRTNNVHAPMLYKKLGPVNVIGDIVSIEKMEEGGSSRVILSNLDIEKLDKENTPSKIRLKVRKDGNIKIGQRVKSLSLLNPPSPPLLPDGFDFRRYLYFQGIGAIGFMYYEPEIIKQSTSNWQIIEKLRHNIASKITASLPPEQAAVGMALMVGQKNSLSKDDRQAIRDAGLAHMLAISGLHVGLVAGALFFFIRLILVMIPNVALRYPVKKIAAVLALCGAIFYMLIAGSTIPTQRAVLMIAIVFLAIIMDRSPISLRLVAFSAIIVLIIAPESLLSASFHMSFAAVTCLIYFYEVTRKFWMDQYKQKGWHRKILLYFISVSMTTLIASVATAPFAIYHFGQVSYLGSLSNFVAVPLLAFIIMPFALISLIAMPFGLEYIPLQVVGVGTAYILDISYWAASLPLAVIRTPAWEFTSFVTLVAASLFMILWKGWGKSCALPFIIISILLAQSYEYPNILVSSSHKLFAFKADDGDLYVPSKRKERFILKNWEKHYGLEEGAAITLPYKGSEGNKNDFYNCGELGCRMTIKGQKISFTRYAYAQNQECDWADIIISVDPMIKNLNRKNRCKAEIVIDKFDTWKNGAYGIWISDKSFTRNVNQSTKNRHWSVVKSDAR